MGVTVEGMKSSAKSQMEVLDYRTGQSVVVGEYYYVCHYNDLTSTESWRGRYTRAAKMAVGSCERRWEGRKDMPPYAISDTYRKEHIHLDGVRVAQWNTQGGGTMCDCDMRSAGILRQVTSRSGAAYWVLFPVPTCSQCDDTGVVEHSIETIPSNPGEVGFYVEPGQRCPWCEGEFAADHARMLWRARQEQKRIAREAEQTAIAAIRSRDSSGL